VICANCGGDNEHGRRFCGDCGAPLAVACAGCGAANPARARFCGDCGAALAVAAPPVIRSLQPEAGVQGAAAAVAAAPLTERRHVSVLFADLVGFTTLSERRDSEEVRDLLTRYFDACQLVVGRYGGVVEKFIGDAVMAVWGTPVAKEDDAERAVRAALEIVDAVTLLGGEMGAPDLRARAGVLSGEATVNLGASGQGMVAGDLVNTASRIQSAAEPGCVYVGDSTKRATDAGIAYRDAGMHPLKGKAEPVHLWQATRVVAGVGGLMKSEGLEPPFVGRDRELKLVKDLFLASAEDGRAHLVQVTGIAGIGKSRLSWEFFKYMDGLKRLFRWHRGRCLAYGEGVTYWALAEMVRGRAGITEGEDRTSAMTKLHQTVENAVPDPTDRKFVEPRLAHLLGLEERTATDKSDLFAGWRLFFERLAAADPVIMVFEDLQWADPSLLEFIDYLLDWSRAFPIFVMTLARPGHEAGLGPRRNGTSISLEPLPPRAMESLLTGLVPGLPAELTAKILERAEGVPLYAVETVRMLLDRKLLVQEGPVYRPAGPVEDLEIPETLHALIAARLDGLTATERRLVQEASVLGKTCTPAALAAVSGLSEREIEPVLASLVAKEVLTVQADPRSPERGQYAFLQDLVRTVAYETLPKKDRKAMHLSVASFLQVAWGSEEGEVVEVVASHFLEAHRLAPDAEDAPEIRELARKMLIRAGDRAASLAAPAEARAYFERAAELTDAPTERAALVERAGAMALQMGQLEQAGRLVTEARRLFEESGQSRPAARAEAGLAEIAFQQGHLDQAIERARHAYQVLAGDEQDATFALVTGQFGRFLALAGDPEAASVLEVALRLAEQLQLREVYSQALSSRSVALMREGRHDETITLLRRALDVAIEGDFTTATFRAWNNLAVTLEGDDRYQEVVELIGPTLEMARRKGDRVSELAALLGNVAPFLALGRWDEAIGLVEEAEAGEDLGSMPWASMRVADAVPIHLRRGEIEAARQLFAVARSRVDEHNDEIRARVGCVEVELLNAEGRHVEALSLANQLLEMVPALGLPDIGMKRTIAHGVEAALELGDLTSAKSILAMVRSASPGLVTPSLRGHSARLWARVCARSGDHDPVEAGFIAAIAEFREIGMPFELGVTLLELAEWLHGQGRPAEASGFGLEAQAVFERLGARPWLERVQSMVVSDLGLRHAAGGTGVGGDGIRATAHS
jgi:class 3 adenylate cyclase/tetratricopeptide (TPR) repeat protein